MADDRNHFFQAAKSRVLKRVFQPADFIKGKKMFVRKVSGQIHAVQFQASTWGGKYFVNVGLSFDCLPGMSSIEHGIHLDFSELDVLDLFIYARLE